MGVRSSLFRSVGVLIAILTAAACGWTQSKSAQSPYHQVKKTVLGGEGGWDYFTADPSTHRVYIARGEYVMVLDADGNVVGKMDVGKDNEAHAVAMAPDLRLAFTSNGGGSSVTVFDPETMSVVREVKIKDRDTDDIMYEPSTKRVFTSLG